ncbi:hypothetical protein NDU88_001525 [Pleurodeles waltl]|uniref:Uncharacterized protein n=1 Tax=Pleurodeles waltl TaxID=8319 RepID=A0AAV7VAN6_PLEWA|nr:hypothetical protein NDU88_001525 [Pleurodeles waltl]
MDAGECSGGARAGSLRPESHTRKPRAPYRAAGKRSSQWSRNPVRGKKGKRWEKEWGKKEILVATFLEVIPTYLRLQGHQIK